MKILLNSLWHLPLLTMTWSFWADSAFAYQIFFGEDLNGDGTIALPAYPQASAAEARFFQNLTPDVIVEDFEGFAPDTRSPLDLFFGQAGQATLGGTSDTNFIARSPQGVSDGLGRYPISGEQYWRANAEGNNFFIDFSQEVAAFGFYGIDIGDFGGQLKLHFENGTEVVRTEVLPNTPGSGGETDGSVLFFGIIAENPDELFTRVSFALEPPLGSVDIFAFDNMTVANFDQVKRDPPVQRVPEPGSIIAAIATMGGIVWRQQRRCS